jgi:beta-lactamase superfamily II metal-dependent hydrolase
MGVCILALAPAPPVSVHFLAVPGGASTLIQASDGRRVLVDGGSSGPALVRLLSEVLPPWERTIDLVVPTNPKPQHLAGLLAVMQRYDVRAVAESGLPGDTPEYAEWRRLLAERSLTPAILRQGMRIDLEDAAIDVLHPTEPWLRNVRTGVDRSDTSVVLELRAHGQRVVLASDVRARSILGMTDRGLLAESVVLHLPASSGAATLALLHDTLRPTAVVLSGSELELSRSPQRLDESPHGAQLLRSDLDGTVRLTITPAGGELRGTIARAD